MNTIIVRSSSKPPAALASRSAKVETPEEFMEMPEEYRQLVIRQLSKHTEGELSGADDYTLIFYPLAPNTYEKAVCCDRAKEELDHFDRGAAVLRDIGVDLSYLLGTKLEDRNLYATEGVKEINDWIERGLFSFIGEDAVMHHLVEMRNSSYKPLGDMLESVIKDEKVHIAHGYRIIREICQTESGRMAVQRSLERMWPATLDLFGRSDSHSSTLYLKWGLRELSNEQARQRFVAHASVRLGALGLTPPDDRTNRKFL
jgi:ring-1,2-phenylacetyl-CoA epoxidase subunit PaaA